MNIFKLISSISFAILQVISLAAQDIPRTFYVLNGWGQTLSKMILETEVINNNIFTVGSVTNRIYTYNNRLYVVTSTPDGIIVIDPVSDQVIHNISLKTGSNPWDMGFVGSNKAYVTNYLANSVTILDLRTGDELNTINVGSAPEGIIIVDNTAYVCNSGGYPYYSPSSISIIDTRKDSVTKILDVMTNPQDAAVGPNGNIYIVCTGDYGEHRGKIIEINPYADVDYTPLVTDTIDVGGSPTDIVVTNSGIAYLADFGNGTNGFVYAYDIFAQQILNGASDPILVGNGAMALLYDPFNDALYVNNYMDDAVQLLSPTDGSVIKTYLFGDGPQHFAILEEINASDPWADAVVSFTPGEDAVFGLNYFPNNVLGPPDPDPLLSEYNPSNKPQEILSLGESGIIILEFTDNYIVDRDGPDFTVFENVFLSFSTSEPFIEAAFVAVSMDGETWAEFPWDTSTFAGFAGVKPTFDNQNYADPDISGGDQFDLADIGLPYAKYIRLRDLGPLKKEGQFNGDFDLDAVVAINSQEGQPNLIAHNNFKMPKRFILHQNYPNPFNPVTTIEYYLPSTSRVNLNVYNMLGEKMTTLFSGTQPAGTHHIIWDAAMYASGVYYYTLVANGKLIAAKKLMLMK